MQNLFDDEKNDPDDGQSDDQTAQDEPFILSYQQPQSAEETIRQTGLAYSIGVAFVIAIGFMLFLGWLADVLLGSSPWGIVGGIILGSIIGFVQLFRISSQIFKKDTGGPAEHPILPPGETRHERRDRFDEP